MVVRVIFNDLDEFWRVFFITEMKKRYMINLFNNLYKERKKKIILPSFNNIFGCFKFPTFDRIKIVIVGQDPYCLKNQAHGFAFSLPPGIKLTPSLKNIYKELYDDLGINNLQNGCLIKWAEQGVFLLNSILTVEFQKPNSHADLGWEIFTNHAISFISENSYKTIFIFFGRIAARKIDLINFDKHFVLYSAHPSSRSANKGFFKSRPFSKANMYLKLANKSIIDWNVI